MGVNSTLYNLIFKKTSTFSLFMVVGAFAVETVIDHSSEVIFNSVNQGKLWHHIEHKYVKQDEEE